MDAENSRITDSAFYQYRINRLNARTFRCATTTNSPLPSGQTTPKNIHKIRMSNDPSRVFHEYLIKRNQIEKVVEKEVDKKEPINAALANDDRIIMTVHQRRIDKCSTSPKNRFSATEGRSKPVSRLQNKWSISNIGP